jgi:hypothetical protein
MGTHMKTTIEIPDSLFKEAKRLAARDGTTVKTLIENGLRQVISQRKHPHVFKLRKATFKGRGIQPSASGLNWDQLRELVYEGQGG